MNKQSPKFDKKFCYTLLFVDSNTNKVYVEGDEDNDFFLCFPFIETKSESDLDSSLMNEANRLGFTIISYTDLLPPKTKLDYSFIDKTPGVSTTESTLFIRIDISNNTVRSGAFKTIPEIKEQFNIDECYERMLSALAKRIA